MLELTPEMHPDVHWSIMIRDVSKVRLENENEGGGRASGPTPSPSSTLFALNPADCLKTASIGKLFLLAEVMRQAEVGTISLVDVIDRDYERPDDPMEDSGLLYMLNARTWTVADLAVLIGAFSDNYATNLLVEHAGLGNVQRCTREILGYRTSNLLDKVRWERPPGPQSPDDMSRGCADELCDYMSRLAHGTLISAEASQQIIRWLAADADTSMASGAFNVDPLAHWPSDAGFRLCHKTGTESDVRCDVGLVRAESTGTSVTWAILANWDKARHGDLRDEVLAGMRGLGAKIRRYACAETEQERGGVWE
ncbi:serine hydrolase [Bifidobacterium sp.]|jgi:beta-lactamase class A|uniref:serine hydrolase n=1 Tax=Bifidobacterium sp. TaxID=41200 RepID=UPI0025B95AC5|nr:serine hydrolase [Bifidobacterium sp.]MCH4209353.1 class A beta-lactamase-related serine hydrolase [Bifidobacterium sp.]MCI1224147.1 class A beta-lactamase-related serine hydrolase [Bifidobacterium sp.]